MTLPTKFGQIRDLVKAARRDLMTGSVEAVAEALDSIECLAQRSEPVKRAAGKRNVISAETEEAICRLASERTMVTSEDGQPIAIARYRNADIARRLGVDENLVGRVLRREAESGWRIGSTGKPSSTA